jgi:hypothetical protein
LGLDYAQLIERYVAAHEMTRFNLGELRLNACAQVLDSAASQARATRM